MSVSPEFLRQATVFADLEDEALEQLVGEAAEQRMASGEWLFHEGEEADSLYLIRSGRLEVVDEGPPETVIRELRRGAVLGELALLAHGRRTASMRARRDTELVRIGRDHFEALVASEPSFAVGLTRAIGAQLAANRATARDERRPGIVAVLALDEGMPPTKYSQMLVEALCVYGTATELAPGSQDGGDQTALALNRAEESNDRVVLAGTAGAPGDAWTEFCIREADLVVAITRGRPSPDWSRRPTVLKDCELLVSGTALPETTLACFDPRQVRVVAGEAGLAQEIKVLARRISGASLGVVFSGGGARAFAHIGVLKEFEAAGLEIDRIAGVSLGSLVGAGVAMGHSSEELTDLFRTGFIETNPTGDYSLPLYSMIRGRRTTGLLEGMFGDRRIEELEKQFFCLSCDIVGRESVVHRTGLTRDAVLASLSIPGVFPPIPTPEGRLLVDGGVLDNLPVETMATWQEGPVIAVDVTGQMGGFRHPARPGVARLKRPLRRLLTGSENGLPRLAETIVRTVTVGSIDTAEASRRHADLVIQPEVDGVGILEWDQLDRVSEAGRLAARTALSEAGDWLDNYRRGNDS